VAVLFRFLLSCVDNRLGAFDGRPADAQVPGDVVAGVTGVGPLTFRHCGGMTEVRPAALAFTGQAAFQGLDGTLQRNDFAGEQVFADEVFVGLAAGGLEKVNSSHRNLGPTELPASLQAALPRDQPARGRHHNRMEQADLCDAVRKRSHVAQVFPVAETDLDLVNGKSWPVH
jgi:hypothetical protein